MINTNSTVFKFASCAACTVMAVLATLLVSNKVYRGGFTHFKTPVSQNANVSQDGNTNADQAKAGSQKPTPAAFDKDKYKNSLKEMTKEGRKRLFEEANRVPVANRTNEQKTVIESVNSEGDMI